MHFAGHRIADKRVLRLLQTCLKAGVLEDGLVSFSDKGTGQGSVISPLLANIYLHYVFDLWAEQWRKREAKGDMIIVRSADDFGVGFEHGAEARRFLEANHRRLAESELRLPPDKPRRLDFARFRTAHPQSTRPGRPHHSTLAVLTFC